MFTNTSGTLVLGTARKWRIIFCLLKDPSLTENRERHQIQFSTVCQEYRVRVRSALRIHRRKNTEKAGSALDLELAGVYSCK